MRKKRIKEGGLLLIIVCCFNITFLYGQSVPVDTVLSSYTGGSSIYATHSITLENGFTIPSGNNVHLYIGLPSGLSTIPMPDNLIGSSDSNMNWIESRSFDETGKLIGDSKAFFDDRGVALQTQTKTWVKTSDGELTTHVLATQPIYDAYDRPVVTTMAAPIDSKEFIYKPGFVQDGSDSTYSYRDFDRYNNGSTEVDKTDNPDPVGSKTTKGTLGWYYSSNNTWEPYTAQTDYPYSRTVYYRDGTGNVKKSAGAGEAFKAGSGHETASYITPVANELDFYIQIRNKFFTTAELGEEPISMTGQAMQTIARDPNGKEAISIADKDGKTVMTALAGGSDLTVNNSVTIRKRIGDYGDYIGNVASVNVAHYYGDPVNESNTYHLDSFHINSSQEVSVYQNGTLVYEGMGSNYSANQDASYVIESQASFSLAITGNTGLPIAGQPITRQWTQNSGYYDYTQNDFAYFKISQPGTTVQVTGQDSLEDMSTELVTANFSNATLAQGYYKLIAADPYSPNTLTYTNTYSDISYNFYDQLGQLVATIPPEGVEKLLNGGINNYTNKLTIPYITLFTYNQKGQLLSSWNSDEGKSEFVYRRDGNIRFSQNSVQRSTGRYSYTNYDNLGRAIESGEYEPLSGGIAFNADLTQSSAMKGILENTTTTGGLTGGNRYDVVRTHYDLPDNTHGLTAYIISDDDLWTLRGAVTVTEKYSEIPNGTTDNSVGLISRTRYNYDEEGKMLWELRYITNLGYKSTDYTYDAMGRLVKKIYQKGTPTETFVHYYTYNDNQQIDSVFTNTTDNIATKQLQAHYVYGLMGEVKRMELGNGVQGLDYTYLLDGSLKAVNNSDKTADPGGDGSNGFLPDAFGMTLDYYTNDYLNTRSGVAKIKGVNAGSYGTDSYNGNIKAMTWYSSKPASVTGLDAPTTNVFKYDDHYRFTENNWGTGLNFANSPASFTATTYNKEKIVNPTNPQAAGYDSHGNILSLQRTNTTGQLVDNFTYNYKPNSNELATVVNSATGTAQTYASYSYDSLGQLIAENTEDTSKTKYLKYDVTGKVVLVARDAAFSRKVAEFVYDETGARIAKKSYNTAGQLVETTWYTGDAIYIQTTGAATPEEYAIDGGAGRIGTFYRQDNVYAYELRDQTGNVRAVVAKSGSSLEVRGYSDYYPYGMVLRSGGTDYRYGYQGAYAEKDGETDWNAFELRMYDSRIARWLTTDPAGQYYSPYIAMGNDPVNGTDPDGAYTHAGAILRWVGGGFKGSVFHQNNGYAAGQWGIETKGPSQSFYDPKSSLNGVSVSEKVDYGHIDYPEIDNAISAYDNARQLEMQTAYRSSHPWGREALGDDLVGQAFGWYAGSKTLGLIGEGVATLFGSAAKTSMTTVGRWMSKAEYEMMAKTGQMVEGAGGQTFVGKGGSSAFNAATKGSVYAEFQVPTSSLLQGGRANWFKVIGPSAGKAMQGALEKQGGQLLPKIQNLSPIMQIK